MRLHPITSLFVLLALSACGGGGDDAGSSGGRGPVTYPSVDAYGWTLKAAGTEDAAGNRRHGLSLVHPAQRDTEYVIESAGDYATASASVTDARLLSHGAVDQTLRTATAMQPQALLYIVGGDVVSLPMQANGRSPKDQARRAQSNSACSFVLAAENHAWPEESRFIVSTRTGDTCANADGRAEVRFAGDRLIFTPLSAIDAPLAVVRDSTTLAPRGWIYASHIDFWNGSSPAPQPRGPSNPITGVVAVTPDSALVQDDTRLSVLDFGAGATVTEVPLDAALTAGGHWEPIGYDKQHYFVYNKEAVANPAATWEVLRIKRDGSEAVSLATGRGVIAVASMGVDAMYLTVLDVTTNRLVLVDKDGHVDALPDFSKDDSVTVQTGANGKHLLWQTQKDVATGIINNKVRIIDETGATVYDAGIAFPMFTAEAKTFDYDLSESRTSFLFAEGFTSQTTYSGARLVAYDTSASAPSATLLGSLPTFNSNFVTSSVTAGPTSLGAGYAARTGGLGVSETDVLVFSFDIGTQNSLTLATH